MKKGKNADQPTEAATGAQEDLQTGKAGSARTVDTEAAKEQPEIESGEPADPCQSVKEALAAKERDFAVLSDKYLRLAAEYDNFRRRSQKEKDALYVDSIALVVKEMLPVLDNLDRAELSAAQYDHEDARKIAEGISMIQRQVDQALERLGVCKIDCDGQPFNPELHEAVMHVEDESVGASMIVAELQKGYRRDDRVIRHSMVKVAN